jgi:hypothetical protein
MCVIITGTERKPSLDVLEKCERANGHGTGMAWVTRSGDVAYQKGLDPQGINTILESLTGGRQWAIHFRLATVGGTKGELSHPFPIVEGVPLQKAGKAPAVLFHNGHWGNWQEAGLRDVVRWGHAPLKGPMSDSRMVAHLVQLYGEEILPLIPGKYLILTPQGATRWPENETDWHELDGCYYSNRNWDTGAYCGTHYGRSHYAGATTFPEIRDGKAVVDQRTRWEERLAKAGYKQDGDTWIGPKAKVEQLTEGTPVEVAVEQRAAETTADTETDAPPRKLAREDQLRANGWVKKNGRWEKHDGRLTLYDPRTHSDNGRDHLAELWHRRFDGEVMD